MKNKINTTIAIIALFIISIILIYQLNPYTPNLCCDKVPLEESCDVVDVPKINENLRLDSEKVMTYYKLDDNCNFQTLVFNGYKKLNDTQFNRFTILGRFTGEILPNNIYKIERLEVKIFELDKRDSSNKKRYKIVNVKPDKKRSTEEDVIFIMTITEDENYTSLKEVDYIYGTHLRENAVNLNTNANISFTVKRNEGNSRPTGGYECDGKAIVSGGS